MAVATPGLTAPAAARTRTRSGRGRRVFVVTHRSVGLVLGLFILVQATTGALLVFQPEMFRWAHAPMYHPVAAPAGPARVDLDAAAARARASRAGFAPTSVAIVHGVDQFESDDGRFVNVDPTTGRVLGSANPEHGILGFLANLHECGLDCAGYTGTVGFLKHPIPVYPTVLWGGLLLGLLGLAFVFLVVGGIVIWWPGRRRLRGTWRIRWRSTSYKRNLDLHRVLGAAVLPFLAMWAVTGAALELPAINLAWYAATGSTYRTYDPPPSTAGPGPDVGLQRAAHLAVAALGGGRVGAINAPVGATGSYVVRVSDGYDEYHAILYGPGDWYVAVDRHTGTARPFYESRSTDDLSQLVWSQTEGVHEGTFGPWYVRMVWVLVGLTPLLLTVTGAATWWHRRRRGRRRAVA